MPYAVGDRVIIKISLSPEVPRGSEGKVTRVLAGKLYDVSFDEKPDGSQIDPPLEETVAENNLAPAAVPMLAHSMRYSVGDRVAVKISLSPEVPRGSKGDVTGVIAGGLYDVLFDEKPDGSSIAPPSEETVAEQNLAAG